jgi:RHH-type rel operon transcriptional repressor/antitoxin RelB
MCYNLVGKENKMSIGVRLPIDLEERLNDLCKETHRTRSFYIREALQEFLDDREDYLLALAVKERISAGKEKLYSLEDIAKEFDL